MTAGTKSTLFLLFAAAAAWRVLLGAPVPNGPPLTSGSLRLPDPPPGWAVVRPFPESSDGRSLVKAAIYRAPDGSEALVRCAAAWADRRTLPVSFFPDECAYLGIGWDFVDRGSPVEIAPGERVVRLEVRKERDHRVHLTGFRCGEQTFATWHDFKTELIWQRIRRQRRLWIKASVVTGPDRQAAAAAAALMRQALRQSPPEGGK